MNDPEPNPIPPLTPAQEAADAVVSGWFQADSQTALPDEAASQRIADQLFLHGILLQHSQEGHAGAMARVDRALQSLGLKEGAATDTVVAVKAPSAKRHRRTWIVSLATTAAAILVGVLFFSLGRPLSAEAAVEQALQQSEVPVDREYRVVATVARSGEHEREISSTLYVRGREKFALRHPALFAAGEIWLGSGGRDLWLVPAIGPVIVDQDSSLLERWIGERNISTPYLQINTILSRFRDRYRLENVTAQDRDSGLPGRGGKSWTRIRGTLKETGNRLPQEAELWADPRTGVVERLVLTWSPGALPKGLQKLTFDLTATRPLPDSLYEHAAHHDPQRAIFHRR